LSGREADARDRPEFAAVQPQRPAIAGGSAEFGQYTGRHPTTLDNPRHSDAARLSRRSHCRPESIGEWYMKKLKHEAELFKAALLAGVQYAEGRKAVEFELTDSASDKALYVYRLLVHDKVISPMPEDQVGEKTIRHRLATWYAHQLPEGHPLLE
jgi:uncharacterized protein DUF5062